MSIFEDYAFPIINSLPPSEIQIPEGLEIDIDQPEPLWPKIDDLFNDNDLRQIDSLKDIYTHNDFPSSNLNEEEQDAIERGIWEYGFEVLAFYKSIHFLSRNPYPGKWGIFVFNFAISNISDEIDQYYPGVFNPDELNTKAFRLLHRHERFHFHIDAWTLSQEAISKTPLYENYQQSIYRPFFPNELVYEESLANRHALNSMKYEKIGNFMYDFMDRQPGAYANYSGNILKFRSKLSANIIDGPSSLLGIPSRERPDQAPWIANGRGYLLHDGNCPVYLIKNIRPSSIISPNIGAPGFKEHNRFVTKYLNGIFNHESDHKYYRIDNGEILKVPNEHSGVDRLKPWEFDGALRKAGMMRSEYRNERASTRTWKKNVPRKSPKLPIV